MWPGSSSAWRKRQQSTRPRLGNTVRPPRSNSSPSEPLDTLESTFDLADSLLTSKRQLEDDSGQDEGDVAAATTFDNGLWTPAAAVPVASATMPAFTATVSLAPASSTSDTDPPSTAVTDTSETLSSIISKTSQSATSTPSQVSSLSTTTSASSKSTSSATLQPQTSTSAKSGSGFKLVYLTPILVFLGLFLLFSIAGRVWGRYHHASRIEAARRAKYDKRASQLAKKQEMQRIKTMWGYESTPVIPAELPAGEHDLQFSPQKGPRGEKRADSSFGSDSDGEGEKEEYPGTFKILSLALLGGGGSEGDVAETRGEGGRKYETGVKKNGWLGVKVRRWVGRGERDEERYTAGPAGRGARRMRHALSRERLRDEKMDEAMLSPTSTLSVGSGELKHKAQFSSVDLTGGHQQGAYPSSPTRYTSVNRDDPFLSNETALGWRKPLPPQPQESPFRPAILNFGLRSRSKTYDPVTTAELDTPVKAFPPNNLAGNSPSGFLPTLGLGISGVWKTITNLTQSPNPTSRPAEGEDEESFIARPYHAHTSSLMSESDTPYSVQSKYEDGTPTKLNRAGTVLHVKSTNQPWSAQDQSGSAMSGTAWTQALLTSPANKPVARKSLLLHQAVTSAQTKAESRLEHATSPFDYSDLVDCYSTPSDVFSPQGDVGQAGIRMLSPVEQSESSRGEGQVGAREKLYRAKTAKYKGQMDDSHSGAVQRSKTATTTLSSSTRGLGRKSTVHHSVRHSPDPVQPPSIQPLRVSKPPLTIPNRASSSPAKSSSPFRPQLPSTLRIASPDPVPPAFISLHLPQHSHYSQDLPSGSPPKRAKAVSNRSDASQDSHVEAAAKGAVHKVKLRETALQEVGEIVLKGYATR